MSTTVLRVLGVIAALSFVAASSPPWLDMKIPVRWNVAGAPLPTAPLPRDADLAAGGRCASQLRPPSTPEDDAVVRLGWSLVGTYQRFGDTSLFLASSSTDGMCRPSGFQAFVFVHGKFAGTLSPTLMDSRSDASISNIVLQSEHSIGATFARYADSDALCCPHASTTVTYDIEAHDGESVVIPLTSQTSADAR